MNNRFVEMKKQLGKFIANFSVTEEDGKEYIFDGDTIHEGLTIQTYDDKGDIVPLQDGEYTIKGVKCVVADGLVSSLPEKESKVEDAPGEKTNEEQPEVKVEEKDPNTDYAAQAEQFKKEVEQLQADVTAKDKRIKELEAEVEELKKKPLASPVPQRTDMSENGLYEPSERVKGTKFETACKIFGNK